jgi:predicted nucleic acid-binding protein
MAEYLIDTNILLRLSRRNDSQYELIQAALNQLNGRGASLYFSLQNITEFWNVQVHDARLAATMEAHGIPYLLTLNQPDFLRYANVEAIHPGQIQS